MLAKYIQKLFEIKPNDIIDENRELIHDVFLCYNRKDYNEAKSLAGRLKNKFNLKVWFDDWSLVGGDDWLNESEYAIIESKSVVVCIGKSGIGKQQNKEINIAISNEPDSIIPVIFASVKKEYELSPRLKTYHYIDYRELLKTKLDKRLFDAIQCKIRRSKTNEPLKKSEKISVSSEKTVPNKNDHNKICSLNVKGNIEMNNLQEQINKTSKGGILELQFGEFHGDLKIIKAITIRSNQLTVTFVGNSPTVDIQSKDVTLENINIVSNDEKRVCLSVKKGCNPKFKNVFVRGNVAGLEDEEGEWDIPDVLNLAIIPNEVTKNRFIINCPVAAKIYPSDIDVIKCEPRTITPGFIELELTIKEIPNGNVITGALIIETEKYKLKRKISLCGNTLNPGIDTCSYQGKFIWQPESYTTIFLPNILPEGEQGEPYEYIFDEDKIGCKDYDISVEGLPDGLRFNTSTRPFKIEGIAKNFSEFKLIFQFQKDDAKIKRNIQLKINEKIIIPLKVSFPDPLKAQENEMIRQSIKIISSNSPNIAYQIVKDLPEGLNLNETIGEIWGKIERHGKYDSKIKINDGTNELLQNIRFLIEPKDALKLEYERSNEVYKDQDFNIPIIVGDADRLSPKLQIVGKKPSHMKVESTPDGFSFTGKFNIIEVHHLDFEVEDIYNRKLTETISIICKEKPTYTIDWISPSSFFVIGEKGAIKSEKITAVIKEDKTLPLKYYLINKPPFNISLQEQGEFTVKIIGDDSYTLRIRAEYGEYKSEKEFVLNLRRESKPVDGRLLKDSIFLREKELEVPIEKTQLSGKNKDEPKIGKAFEKKEDSTNDKSKKSDDKPQKSDKPKLGKAFQRNEDSTDNKSKNSDEKTEKSDSKVKLGGAFQK